MRLRRYIIPRLILMDVKVRSREELIGTIASRLADESGTLDVETVEQAFFDRESLGGTAVGHGVALPHARLKKCGEAMVGLVRLAEPLDLNAPDGKPVWLVAFSAVDVTESHRHMQILARLARTLDRQHNRDAIERAKNAEDVLHVLLQDDEPVLERNEKD